MEKSIRNRVLSLYKKASKAGISGAIGGLAGRHLLPNDEMGFEKGVVAGLAFNALPKSKIDEKIRALMKKHKKVYEGKGVPLSVYTISKHLDNNHLFEDLKPHHERFLITCCEEGMKNGGVDDLSGLGLGASIKQRARKIKKDVKEHFRRHGATYKRAGISIASALALALAGKYMRENYNARQRARENTTIDIPMGDFEIVDKPESDLLGDVSGDASGDEFVSIPQVNEDALREAEATFDENVLGVRPEEIKGLRPDRFQASEEELPLPTTPLPPLPLELPQLQEEGGDSIDDLVEGLDENDAQLIRQLNERMDRSRTMLSIASPPSLPSVPESNLEIESDVGQFNPLEQQVPKEFPLQALTSPPLSLASSDTSAQTEAIRDRERARIQEHYDRNNTPPTQKYDGKIDGISMRLLPSERDELTQEEQQDVSAFLGDIARQNKVLRGRQNITNQSILTNESAKELLTDMDIQSKSRVRSIYTRKPRGGQSRVSGTFPNIKLPARNIPLTPEDYEVKEPIGDLNVLMGAEGEPTGSPFVRRRDASRLSTPASQVPPIFRPSGRVFGSGFSNRSRRY